MILIKFSKWRNMKYILWAIESIVKFWKTSIEFLKISLNFIYTHPSPAEGSRFLLLKE